MEDYRFDYLAYGLRKENKYSYAFSLEASYLLQDNDSSAKEFTEDGWDHLWDELQKEYEQR